METVAIVKVDQSIDSAVEKGFSCISESVEKVFLANQNAPVVIKVNLNCIRTCETGATTDPRLVEATIKYLKKKFNARNIFTVESDATALNADMAFQLLGYNALAEKLGVTNVNLAKRPCEQVNFPNNLRVSSIKMPDILAKPRILISISKLKTHSLCRYTATLKNMYGCNPEPYKAKYHPHLHENIVDFATAFKPDISIVDAMTAMEGTGPTNGTPIRLDTILLGTDPVAVDHAAGRVMKINPNNVKYIRLAEKQGLGTTKYKTAGLRIEDVSVKFKGKPQVEKIFAKIKRLRKPSGN